MTSDEMLCGLALNWLESYCAAQTAKGKPVEPEEARLYTANAVELLQALLNTGIKPPLCPTE